MDAQRPLDLTPLDPRLRGCTVLSRDEAMRCAAAGDGAFAYDVGRLLGLPVALFLLMGRAFYENGGLTGGNPMLRISR